MKSKLSLSHEKAIAELMINMERINSQLSLLCEKVITSVNLGGQINDQHGEDQQSTFTFA